MIPNEQQLLQEVRDYKAGLLYPATYQDYERYKQRFLSYGYYGYEKQIADILEV